MAQAQSGPSQFVVFASAARTTDTVSNYYENDGNAKGVRIFVQSTAGAGFSTTFRVQIQDKKNGVYYTAKSMAAIATVTNDYLDFYPDQGGHVGRGFRVQALHGNANPHTYAVTAEWLP